MISFTFPAEQIRSAPPEVRRWIERVLAAALGPAEPGHDPPEVHAPSLAACTAEEAILLFDLIKGNFLIAQVFLELARDSSVGRSAAPLHALNLADILHHTKLADGDRLTDCLEAINRAFQSLRGDREATLFGFDASGHVYIHEATYQSIRRLWEQLVGAAAPAAAGFAAPQLGPSENIAAHAAGLAP